MKLCECGCGRPAPIAMRTHARDGHVKGQPIHFIKGHNGRMTRRVAANGYVLLRIPGHPRADRGWIAEHVVVVERALGRPVAGSTPIHHFDENRANNRNGNLVLCNDVAYHELLHFRAMALRITGNPNARRCPYCARWDIPGAGDFREQRFRRDGRERVVFYHRSCKREQRRTWPSDSRPRSHHRVPRDRDAEAVE